MLKMISVGVLVFLTAAILPATTAQAQAPSYSPLALVYVGALFVNGGSALANGLALSMDRPDRRNGQFGLVMGSVSMLLAGALYAVDHEHVYAEEAALMLGGAGLVSAVAGGFAIRAANRQTEIIPTVAPHDGGMTVGLRMTF